MPLVDPESWNLDAYRTPPRPTIYNSIERGNYLPRIAITDAGREFGDRTYYEALKELSRYLEEHMHSSAITPDATWVKIPGYLDNEGRLWGTIDCACGCSARGFFCNISTDDALGTLYQGYEVEAYFRKCITCNQLFYKNCVNTGRWGNPDPDFIASYCQRHRPRCPNCNDQLPPSTGNCDSCHRNDFELQIARKALLSNCWVPAKWPVIRKDSDDELATTYGIELEVQDNAELDEDGDSEGELDVNHLYDVLEKAIGKTFVLKSDRSIGDSGAEIVMAPHTYGRLVESIPKLTQALVRENFRSFIGNKCGLHIHVGKEFVPPSLIKKYNAFFQLHRSFVVALSRRKISKLNQWAALPGETEGRDRKYRAIYTDQKNSIEFRLFRGTLNHQTILASVEFLQAIARCYKRMSADKMLEQPESFVKFCEFIAESYKKRAEFPNLIRKLSRMTYRVPTLVEIAFAEHSLGARKGQGVIANKYRARQKEAITAWLKRNKKIVDEPISSQRQHVSLMEIVAEGAARASRDAMRSIQHRPIFYSTSSDAINFGGSPLTAPLRYEARYPTTGTIEEEE